jgi:hydroxyethylthiazole kinase
MHNASLLDSLAESLSQVRRQSPLVHNITNYVVMNNTANALLAVGASPVMAHALPEVPEMTRLSGALVLNIGTLNDEWIAAMSAALETAKAATKPVVLDPVGAGATSYRTEQVQRLLAIHPPTLLRGNASEVMALVDARRLTKGVDSQDASEAALAAAQALHAQYGCVVCISGNPDLIVGGENLLKVFNGHPLMTRVTGLGCTASALCGAFLAVTAEPTMAVAAAMAALGLAGERAEAQAQGPGSLQLHLLDQLYQLTPDDVRTHGRVVAI